MRSGRHTAVSHGRSEVYWGSRGLREGKGHGHWKEDARGMRQQRARKVISIDFSRTIAGLNCWAKSYNFL